MSLMIPRGPCWRYCPSNLTGTPSQSSPGSAVTAGANAVDGTAVSLLSALSADVEMIEIGFAGFFVSGGNGSCLADLLIDPAGGTSWTSLIDDLIVGQTLAPGGSQAPPLWYFFPIWIKSGTSVGIRIKTIHTSNITARVIIKAYGGNANPASWWCGQRVTSIGIDASNCIGQAHTAGNSGAFSSWTDLGSTLAARAGAFQFSAQGTFTDTTQQTLGYHFQFGIGGDQIGPTLLRCTSTTENGWITPTAPIYYDAPSGAQLQVRGTCQSTSEIVDVAAYAVH